MTAKDAPSAWVRSSAAWLRYPGFKRNDSDGAKGEKIDDLAGNDDG
ncbi:hypothetical protein [Microseira wollei]|nr:hypothetical protein [Microseira wollei]